MNLLAGLQLLLQHQAFILLGALLRSSRQGQLVQGFTVQSSLFCQLPGVTPALNTPGQRRRAAGHDGQQHDNT